MKPLAAVRHVKKAALVAVMLALLLPSQASASTYYSWGTKTYTPSTWPVPLQGDLWGPDPSPSRMYTGVVEVHGGFATGTRDWNTGTSHWLAENGYVVLNIDFRLAPTWRYPAPENDIKQAVAWLAARTYISRIAVMGTSSGAIMAEELATKRKMNVYAYVAWSGMGEFDHNETRIAEHLGCSYDACPDLWNSAEPITHVDTSDRPIYVAHATGDAHIAVWTDDHLMAKYVEPHTYYRPDSTRHGEDFMGDQVAMSGTLAFLGR
jgi:poly(3-hydroxybutyrate) depolymerase